MARLGKAVIWAGLETLFLSGSYRLARPFLSGVGAILTFHHIKPTRPDGFQPNRSLEITPTFFNEILGRLREEDIDIVSMDEVCRRVEEQDFRRRFVALTFDDGYRDFAEHAWPILERHAAPATIYVASSFAEGTGVLWWIELERAIARSESIELMMDGELRRFVTATDVDKQETFNIIYWWLRSLPSEAILRQVVRNLALDAGVDVEAICQEFCLGWRDLAALDKSALVTIGSHTDTHLMLRKWSDPEVREEMASGVRRIEANLGQRPVHFSFPVGDPTSAGPREFELAAEAGFRSAVTTRPGVLFPEHRDHLTALPRLSVNGDFQRLRYVDVLLSGVPSALLNGFRRVDAA